jgi:hypothetical protein
MARKIVQSPNAPRRQVQPHTPKPVRTAKQPPLTAAEKQRQKFYDDQKAFEGNFKKILAEPSKTNVRDTGKRSLLKVRTKGLLPGPGGF